MQASRPPHHALQVGDEAAFSTELARLLREPPRLARMRLAAQQYSASLQHTLKQQPSVSAAVDDFEAHLRTAMCRRAPAAGRPLAAGGRLTGRLALLSAADVVVERGEATFDPVAIDAPAGARVAVVGNSHSGALVLEHLAALGARSHAP